jgi:pentatricopeptide repeat protein
MFGANRDGVAADVKTYNTLIDTWAKTGKAVEAEKFYVLMKRYHSSPHMHHRARNTHTTHAHDDVLKYREGLQPTMYTIASLMDAYTRADQFEKVLRLISRMKKEGRAPDNVVFNLLIDTYGRMGKPEEAEKVLCGAMKEYGIALETNNFTSVIEVHTPHTPHTHHTHTHTPHRIAHARTTRS